MRTFPWLLLGAGLLGISLAPGVPGLDDALVWLGGFLIVRGVVLLAPFEWAGAAADIALMPLCLLGLELGGLFLVPAVVAFLWRDATPQLRMATWE